jgi:hypothetical protein
LDAAARRAGQPLHDAHLISQTDGRFPMGDWSPRC